MKCPKCGEPYRVVAKEDDELYSGCWFGRYECKACRLYVDAVATDLDRLFVKLDAEAKGPWKRMRTIMVRVGNKIKEVSL